jgi:hypothetical protein
MLRQKFNADQYVERAARGELQVDVISSDPPAADAHEPSGTLSQRIRYIAPDGSLLAVAHQFLRPDGNIGGHGRPDPKILFTSSGPVYTLHRDVDPPCPDGPPDVKRRSARRGP